MTTPTASPTNLNSTHHVTLIDRDGVKVGLILCDDAGNPKPTFNKRPIDRTALKTTSGNSGYSDFQPPYSPITQDDWSGGRSGLDFERDGTKFYDSFRVNTHRNNKAFLGPQEQYSYGYKSIGYRVPSRYTVFGYPSSTVITWTASANYTIARISLLIKRVGTPTADLTLSLRKADNTVLDTETLTVANVADYIAEWQAVPFSASIVSGTTYKIVVTSSNADASNRWEFGHATPTTALDANYACYIIETADVDDKAIFYEYKGQQYMVLSSAHIAGISTAAPTLWMNGDRGAADSNALGKLYLNDATKAWTVNQWAGCIVKIVQGVGKDEVTQYRRIVSNTATALEMDSIWGIAQDTTTEYVILGSEVWREITGHGLTVPVTDVLVTGEIVYFAQGDSVFMRSHREYNNAGTWTESDWNAEATYAVYLAYQPLANKIWRAQNSDATGIVSVSSATPAAYGTDLSFAAVIAVGGKYEFINGIEVYPNDAGTEALWVYKEDLPYVVTTTAQGIKLPEMLAARSRKNGASTLVWGVYTFFTLGNGLQRYYSGSIEDLGPNVGEGLPSGRQGPIISLLGYPGRVLAIVDGGSTGYSSLLERSGSGWHEVYRSPYGQRLKAMALQVIPGSTIDRLWLYQGNLAIWLPFPSDATSELSDTAYKYTHEGALILSRMHAGMFDTQKLIKNIKIWTDELESGIAINVDYRLDDATTWTQLTGTLITSPVSTLDCTSVFGISGKRIQLRIRFSSNDNTKTPILLAAIVEAVIRTQIKYMYDLTFRVIDNEPTLIARDMDNMSITAAGQSAVTKLAQLEAWADADTDSMLYMESTSPLYHGKYIFLNPPATRQIAVDADYTKQWTGNAFVCLATAQEA